ncbi:uncharacterized protein N7473_011967 [Penicillium subrubescens]|uniref:uncharacterized protein n=1 Tax=Penicillium subrubescens TaxID=1316194 RepID=UPI00254545C9|nr:uncharacterized protein N7473_011967 [Penicillium subrubescens]KAJ5880914.1 hypothetical protein N7473_011967 [Penicillium subrubescens]
MRKAFLSMIFQLGLANLSISTDDASIASLFGRTTARPGRTEIFNDVCKKTGAFIQPPVESDTQLFIWGNETQVENAKTELQHLVIRHRDRQLAEMERRSSPGSRTSRTRQKSAQRLMRPGRHLSGNARKPLAWDKIGPYHSIEQMKRKQEHMALE